MTPYLCLPSSPSPFCFSFSPSLPPAELSSTPGRQRRACRNPCRAGMHPSLQPAKAPRSTQNPLSLPACCLCTFSLRKELTCSRVWHEGQLLSPCCHGCASLCLPIPSDNSQAAAPDLVVSNCTFLHALAAGNTFLVLTCKLWGPRISHMQQRACRAARLSFAPMSVSSNWWRISIMLVRGDLCLASSYRLGARQRGSRPPPPGLLSWWHPKHLHTPLVLHPM